MITALVVDDQPLVRQAVRDILSSSDGIHVVGEASNGREAVRAAAEVAPDVVIMDIRMPELDGIAATWQITTGAASSRTRVLILTTFEEDEYIVAALRAGVSGFIGKGRSLMTSSARCGPSTLASPCCPPQPHGS